MLYNERKKKGVTDLEKQRKPRALVAMSGGVDSSAAAILALRGGYDVAGVMMRLYTPHIGEPACSTARDAADAAGVAASLGIPFSLEEAGGDFDAAVIRPFIRAYEEGRTPNPCIDCNRHLKFGTLLRYARDTGFDCLVTGHYARVETGANGRRLLKRARAAEKDQSYVLYSLTQSELAYTRFPLGELASKEEARALVADYGLPVANKGESQDICFVPDGDYAAFIERYTGKSYPAGDFLDGAGHPIGRHRGIIRYTVGQRKGLGLALPAPLYVAKKDIEKNTVTLLPESELYTSSLTAGDFNWIACEPPAAPIRVTAKTRYRAREVAATARVLPDARVRIEFDAPERAVTPGQAVVLYDGDTVVGGGVIL